jgi:hypothetical protein
MLFVGVVHAETSWSPYRVVDGVAGAVEDLAAIAVPRWSWFVLELGFNERGHALEDASSTCGLAASGTKAQAALIGDARVIQACGSAASFRPTQKPL